MKKKVFLPLTALALLAGLALTGCNGAGNGGSSGGDGGSGGNSGSSEVEEVKINITAAGDKTTLLPDETVQLTADQDGVSWSSTDTSVATVSPTGLVTAVAQGSTTIRAAKEGFKRGSISITVTRAPEKQAKYMIDMEDADHFDPDGVWGMSWGGTFMGPGDSPVEDNGGATEDSRSLGWLTQGCKETLTFTSDKAVQVTIGVRMAYNSSMNLGSVLSVKFNDQTIDMTGKTLDGAADGASYYDWHNIEFGNVTLKNGNNVFEVEMLAQGPNMDQFLIFTEENLVITSVPAAAKLPINVTNANVTLVVDGTAQIEADVTGLSYASSNAGIASVSSSGLITAVAEGNAEITVSKEGYKDAKVAVRVNPKPVEGQIKLEAEQGVLSDGAQIENDANSSGGARVGYLSGGTSVTITAVVEEAGQYTVSFRAASNNVSDWSGYPNVTAGDLVLSDCMTLKLDGDAIDLAGKVVEGGAWGTWRDVSLGNISLTAESHEFLFEFSAQGPNLDFLLLAKVN